MSQLLLKLVQGPAISDAVNNCFKIYEKERDYTWWFKRDFKGSSCGMLYFKGRSRVDQCHFIGLVKYFRQ